MIRLFSDIHWEFEKNSLWEPIPLETDKDTILVLAGDLQNGTRSLDHISKFNNRFKRVLIVLGNHDYWGEHVNSLAIDYENRIHQLELKNVILLDRSSYEDSGYLFIGATLWTNMNNRNCLTESMADFSMGRDFANINVGYNEDNYYIPLKFRPKHWMNLNDKEFNYIKTLTELNKDKKIIIITHHGCTLETVHDKFKDNESNYFFVSDYSNFILDNLHIKYWFHGHQHAPANVKIGETTILVNPRGYPNEKYDNTTFDEVMLLN